MKDSKESFIAKRLEKTLKDNDIDFTDIIPGEREVNVILTLPKRGEEWDEAEGDFYSKVDSDIGGVNIRIHGSDSSYQSLNKKDEGLNMASNYIDNMFRD